MEIHAHIDGTIDWKSDRVGTFFIKTYSYLINNHNYYSIDPNEGKIENISRHLDRLFTLPGQELSLPNIAHLLAITNINVLKPDFFDESDPQIDPIIRFETLEPEFMECFAKVTQNNTIQTNQYFYSVTLDSMDFDQHARLVCNEKMEKFSECQSYCAWHQDLFKKWSREEFLTVMKYAIPQNRVVLKSASDQERILAQKMFQEMSIGKLQHEIAPSPMPIFCFDKKTGFKGDDLGMLAKVCNDFHYVPNDLGIGLSTNLNVHDIMEIEEPYEDFFDHEDQNKSYGKLEGGNLWSQMSFVISTQKDDKFVRVVDSKRSGVNDFPHILIQLHQDQELGLGRVQANFNKYNSPLKLKKGYEYHIDVTPTGQISSESFKSLNQDQRDCLLQDEGLDNSIFKIYKESNCKYECHVMQAKKVCQCQPWEFFASGERLPECDVFGRTCFHQMMEHLSQSPDQCQCYQL